ncbi:MAG: hypothetical protein A3J52_00840 [Omnitrophica bacterium RIFCSPHIGHO2_02_FULL_49_9]|nr:MAG: hypothetical protein A3J52_00840 [Omnitrophica bacterium RIFCSPHIGHO2_02_FULL_49_9]
MQEDKKPLFASCRLAQKALGVLELVIRTIEVEEANCRKASKDSFLFATDVLEYLVKRKVPFREAHQIVGSLVQRALDSHTSLSGLPFEVYQEYSRIFKRDVFECFEPELSVRLKSSAGSTRPDFVLRQVRRRKSQLKAEVRALKRSNRERGLV